MEKNLITDVLEYQSAETQDNANPRTLAVGSQNVIIDTNKKVRIRNGISRFGAADTTLTPVRKTFTWNTSTGTELPLKFYDDEFEAYFGTVDGTVINAYKRIANSLSTTETPRGDVWWKDSETLDVFLWVQGDDDLREWSGAVAVVDSIAATTITKKGTTTWAQNRFYAVANKVLVNVRTGTEYTYTGGESTTTLTGIADTTGIVAGDILVQKVLVRTNEPASGRNNHTLFVHENQVFLGSEDDNEVYISQNDDAGDYSFSSPRVSGEGALLTLTGISKGFGSLSQKAVCFAGNSDIFTAEYEQITVSTTLAETLKVKKLKTGVGQGSYSPDTITPVGNALIYLSNEPAVRLLEQPENIEGSQLKTLSYPIKPDIEAETWTNATASWYRNTYLLSAPASSRVYMLEFREDADGKLRRFWQAPQVGLPARTFFIRDGKLYCGSNGTPETFRLFDPDRYSDLTYNSDTTTDEDTPIAATAKFTYRHYGDRRSLKNFDIFYIEGEITPNVVDLVHTVNYDFNGATYQPMNTINGADEDILVGDAITSSLGQNPLAQVPLAGVLGIPDNARKFRVEFEMAKEDFNELQSIFSTNDLDRYWAITAHGAVNVEKSKRKNLTIRK